MNAVPLARVRYAAARSATPRSTGKRFETTSRRGCGNAAERGGLAMSDAEAEKEAREAATVYIHEMRPEWHDRGVGIVQGSPYRNGFEDGAAWQASRAPQPTEAEWSCEQGCKALSAVCLLDHRPAPQPPEDDREALALAISEARGS